LQWFLDPSANYRLWLLPQLWSIVAEYAAADGGLRRSIPSFARALISFCSPPAALSLTWAAECTPIKLDIIMPVSGIAPVPCGLLLATCHSPCGVFTIEPSTGEVVCIAGAAPDNYSTDGPGHLATFVSPAALLVVQSERCAFVSDWARYAIRRVTLPARLFTPRSS
jgi:hypothetical protein